MLSNKITKQVRNSNYSFYPEYVGGDVDMSKILKKKSNYYIKHVKDIQKGMIRNSIKDG